MALKDEWPSGDKSYFKDYLNPDADTVLGKVDFVGMVSLLVRSWFTALITAATGAWLAAKRAYVGYTEDVFDAGDLVWDALMAFPQNVQQAAVNAAANDLRFLQIFALPSSVAITLGSFGVIALIAYIFILGGGE